MATTTTTTTSTTPLDSSFPVGIPEIPELFLPEADFDRYILTIEKEPAPVGVWEKKTKTDKPDASSSDAGSNDVDATRSGGDKKPTNPLISALEKSALARPAPAPAPVPTTSESLPAGVTRTANNDKTYADPGDQVVSLFYSLHGRPRHWLEKQLRTAWEANPELALRAIFNARSIHVGKSDSLAAYQAIGWLYRFHPQTLLTNLKWLVRPVVARKKPADGDAKVAATELGPRDGVSHGYWKDLLNILVLAARGSFDHTPLIPTRSAILTPRPKPDSTVHSDSPDEAKLRRAAKRDAAHANLLSRLDSPVFKALYVTVARLFAEQLKQDIAELERDSRSANISLAAKWAPTAHQFHDLHTTITSAIAELMFPLAETEPLSGGVAEIRSREDSLRLSRELLRRKVISPLRKHLAVVERSICAKKLEDVNYERVPTLALERYADLFFKRDTVRFEKYLRAVSDGKAGISGATLNPGRLVKKAIDALTGAGKRKSTWVDRLLVQGQWQSVVRKVKESGAFDSCIAVCDVSGSMTFPTLPDDTNPLHHAIGFSLLMSEVAKPPFGGHMITFSTTPEFLTVGGASDKRGLVDQVDFLRSSHNWGMSTDLVAVFERLILPTAVANAVPPEDMVRSVYVFSDMHFNQGADTGAWSSSFERIKAAFAAAGYDMPALYFWNLAAPADGVLVAPVQADQPGTALLSGVSQGTLRALGLAEAEEAEAEAEAEPKRVKADGPAQGEDEKEPPTPLETVKKILNIEALSMIKVVD